MAKAKRSKATPEGEAVPMPSADNRTGPPLNDPYLNSMVPTPPSDVEGTLHLCYGIPPGDTVKKMYWAPV